MRVLVAGWIGSTNLGDELVFAGLRRLLASRGVQVVAVSQNPRATLEQHGVRAVAGADIGAVARAVRKADVVILGGGGLLQDETSSFNLPYHLSRVEAARRRRTPYAGVGLGVGGVSTVLGRRLVRRGMGAAVAVSVRDQASADLLARLGVPGAVVAADCAFALDPPAVAATDRLVVSLRRWGDASRLPVAARRDTTPRPHIEALARALDETAARTGLTVRFVALQADRDDPLHVRVAELMDREVEFATPARGEVFDEFARARAVVSMRYHGVVAAIMAARPVVLVNYADKVRALADELGQPDRLLAWDPAAFERIPTTVEAALARPGDIAATRERLRERQSGNERVLDQLLEAPDRPGI